MSNSFLKDINLTSEQLFAQSLLEGADNLFLTGAAGTGKSHLVRIFIRDKKKDEFPILASTAAAAVLVGGRTFHSYFGIGIVEGGYMATLERALRNKKLAHRLKKAKAILIDEVSMLSGTHFRLAEEITRTILNADQPWGGLRIIAVGDFAQLPPVNVFGQNREWAFLDRVWEYSNFKCAHLSEVVRTQNLEFLSVLSDIRRGDVTERVCDFLNSRTSDTDFEFNGTRLFARRNHVENYNLSKLNEIESPAMTFETQFSGRLEDVEKFKKNIPIPDVLQIKLGALVMFRQNDVEGRWVNGSIGSVKRIEDEVIEISLLTGRDVEVTKTDFTMLDADGNPVAKANNFPLQLAWALTIHKSQGTTLDRMRVDIRGLWEPGQAYVALSRAKDPQELFVDAWDKKSIFMDPAVRAFYQSLF